MLKNVLQILHTLLKHSVLHSVTASESPGSTPAGLWKCRLLKALHLVPLQAGTENLSSVLILLPAATLLTLPACAMGQAAKSFIPWSLFLLDPHVDFMCCVWGKSTGIVAGGTRNRASVAAEQAGWSYNLFCGSISDPAGPELPGSWAGCQSYPSPQELFLSAALFEK